MQKTLRQWALAAFLAVAIQAVPASAQVVRFVREDPMTDQKRAYLVVPSVDNRAFVGI